MTAASTEEACRNLAIRQEGAAVCIELNSPVSRNAITSGMRAEIAAAVPRLARDPAVYAVMVRSAIPQVFSVGSDLDELNRAAGEQTEQARRMLAGAYELNWLLECFSKPTVSFIDGVVMGSGAGLSTYGTHRVAGEDYAFLLPQTALGLFPDGGLAWILSRMPGQIGLYLGLTGRRIGRADAYRLGLVTHCVPAHRFSEIEHGLRDADPVDPLLDNRHEEPGPGEIEGCREVLERCFEGESVEDILSRLANGARRGGADGTWCAGVRDDLERRSPTALKITFRHIREAAFRDLRQTLTIDYRLARRLLQSRDFEEGIRTLLADTDRQPRWSPGRVAEVTEGMIDRAFATQPGRELILPTRQEMQAARAS